MERTLSIIKPDAVKAKYAGEIISIFEKNGFEIVAMKKVYLTKPQAMEFYLVHKDRVFYDELVDFMTSGPCIVLILEKHSAISENRRIMGATNPEEAAPGTIRKLYGANIENNAVHGSDSPENAVKEIDFFFSRYEILSVQK